MKIVRPLVAAALAAAAMLAPLMAHAQASDKWEISAAVYVYLPTISGKTTFPATGSNSSVSIDAETILENLKMTFMGTLEASNGTWGAFTDLVYMDVGDSKSGTQSFSIGSLGVPAGASANVDYDLKGWVWALAGTYRIVSDRSFKAEALAGARVLDLRQKVSWNLAGNLGSIALRDRAGTREVDAQNWDAIIGVRGRATFAEGGWFIPYYFDVGAGQSKLTWQAMTGVGYSFGWGDLLAAWRYIDYEMKSGKPVESINFNGPGVAAVFRW